MDGERAISVSAQETAIERLCGIRRDNSLALLLLKVLYVGRGVVLARLCWSTEDEH